MPDTENARRIDEHEKRLGAHDVMLERHEVMLNTHGRDTQRIETALVKFGDRLEGVATTFTDKVEQITGKMEESMETVRDAITNGQKQATHDALAALNERDLARREGAEETKRVKLTAANNKRSHWAQIIGATLAAVVGGLVTHFMHIFKFMQ